MKKIIISSVMAGLMIVASQIIASEEIHLAAAIGGVSSSKTAPKSGSGAIGSGTSSGTTASTSAGAGSTAAGSAAASAAAVGTTSMVTIGAVAAGAIAVLAGSGGGSSTSNH